MAVLTRRMACVARAVQVWKERTWIKEVDPVSLEDKIARQRMINFDHKIYDVTSLMRVLSSGYRLLPHNRRMLTNREKSHIILRYIEALFNLRFLIVFLEIGLSIPSADAAKQLSVHQLPAATTEGFVSDAIGKCDDMTPSEILYVIIRTMEMALAVVMSTCSAKNVARGCERDVHKMLSIMRPMATKSWIVDEIANDIQKGPFCDGLKFKLSVSIALTCLISFWIPNLGGMDS